MDTTHRLEAIEAELQKQVARLDEPLTQPLHQMLRYHMGWGEDVAGASPRGKRVRPLLLLLVMESCGGQWLRALPAAAAVELVHNFSLLHDDIQDASETRRGRPTVWSRWGIPDAINAGDAMFVLANQAALDLDADFADGLPAEAARVLNAACLDLTRGQFLDMSQAGRPSLDLDAYWIMIRGKTAALLEASCDIGALLGGASARLRETYRRFGLNLGLAFQAKDDLLGIWGDEQVTGKSASSDLIERKLSLPVVFGLNKRGRFADMWQAGPIQASRIGEAAQLLEAEGAREFTLQQARQLTAQAIASLESAQPAGEPGRALFELTNRLLTRDQ